MRAQVGDRIVVHGGHVGDHDQDGTVVEVRGPDGTPPYVVRWSTGRQFLYFPGPEVVVEPSDEPSDV